MIVVNKNVESKRDIISELKNIKVNSTNKHKEIELDSYIVSIVMIIITSNASNLNKNEYEYVVYMLIQDKKTDDLYGKFNLKTFSFEPVYDNAALQTSLDAELKILAELEKLIATMEILKGICDKAEAKLNGLLQEMSTIAASIEEITPSVAVTA